MTHQSESQDDMNRSTSDCVFWKMNPGSGRQRGIWGEKKNEGGEVICYWWNKKHYSVLVHGMSIRKAACRLIYSIFTLLTHYIYSTSDERNFTILCTVNTVAHSIKLVIVELIYSQVLRTCICAELRFDCLGEETSFIRRLRNRYTK